MRAILFYFLLFFIPIFGLSQANSTIFNPVFYPEKHVDAVHFFEEYKNELALPRESKMVLQKAGFSKFTKNHKRYQQFYKDIPVFGHTLTLHMEEGKVHHVSGIVAPDIQIIESDFLDKENIKMKVLPYFLVNDEGETLQANDIHIIHFEKIIVDKKFPVSSKKYCLAFDVHVMSETLGKNYQYIVHALTGEILFAQDLVCTFHPKGNAPSYHYGTVEIETEQVAPNKFVLRDVTRGNGNTTYLNTSTGDILLSDDDNIWEKPENILLGNVAYDAHYCTMKFYDFLTDRFEYSGIDGNGRSMIARANINNGADLVNAFWNNQNASFGNGNCHYHPLTTFSIVGHEFAHGITSENSKMIYSGESGAMNEAFSDIIGKAFEMLENPDDFQWPIGHEIVATRFARPFRSMEDPTIYGNPKMYQGKHWRDGGGVHSNSGVLNHWYYLLVNGGNGINELDTSYNIAPVGVQDILDIVFLCQTAYLQPASTYPDMFEYSKLACESLFGKNSPQYNSLVEAWKAVGLPYTGIPIENYDDLILTAKVKNDPNNSYTCYAGQYPEINLFIANKGSLFYPKGTVFKVSIIRNGNVVEKNLVLPEDLAPDSIRTIQVLDYQLIDKTEFYSLEINLLHNDHVQSNNRFYLYFQNFVTTGVDLQISGISHKEIDCFNNEVTFSVRVRNNSCFSTTPGEIIQLTVFDLDNNLQFPFSHTVQAAMAPRNETTISAKIPYDWKALNYAFSIQANFDTDPTNNESQYVVIEKGEIRTSKKYTFTDNSFDEDFKHNSTQSRFPFEDDFYFRTKTSFSSNNSPCLEKADNFKNVNGGLAQFTVAETCLDVTGFTQPVLRFDMIQFRSDFYSSFPELEGNSTILKLEFISPDIVLYPEGIKNQDVGQKISHEVLIPKGFKGRCRLVAFTSRHDGTSAINGKNDVILLDNLEISDIVSSDDAAKDNLIYLYPNPVGDEVYVKVNDQEILQVRMIDITGKRLQEHIYPTNIQEAYINTKELVPGCYLLEVQTDKKIFTSKLIK